MKMWRPAIIRRRPQAAMMTLDNGAADGQADPHAATLGGVERFEEPIHALRVETHARILHASGAHDRRLPFGSDHQLPRTIVDTAHRVRGVQEQVQDDLLKLDTIADDRRKVVGKFRAAESPGFSAVQLNDSAITSRVASFRSTGSIVGFLLAEQRAQSRDHVGRAVAVANRAPRGFARAVDIGRIGGQHPQTGAGVGDDARQRLVDFVRDRRRQCAEARDPGHVRELRSGLAERLFRKPALASRPEPRRCIPARPFWSRARVSDHVQVLDRLIGHQQPVLVLEVTAAPPAVDHFLERVDIFRMDPRNDQLERHGRGRIKFEDAIDLL